MKAMKQLTSLAYGLSLAMVAGGATAHGLDDVGAPACLEANFMMANAQNAPFAGPNNGPGNVLEVNIVTGNRGITVGNPFVLANDDSPVCPEGVRCDGPLGPPGNPNQGPFKPTGVLSGGLNGHAFITSAAQIALTEFHRDGTPIRTMSYKSLLGNPAGGFGSLPRPLGTQMMPNGNIIQAICDANFFNAFNSDAVSPNGNTHSSGNASNLFFPPVYSTPARAQNSRLLVLDQESLEVIDEYSYPYDNDRAELWGCMAGIAFTEEGMGISMFHTAAIAMVDWMDGIEEGRSTGVGSNNADPCDDDDDDDGKKCNGKAFELDDDENMAVVTRWIDLRADANGTTVADDHPSRRDSLRAWGLDEDGTIYVTDRERSQDCLEGQVPGTSGGCNPSVFRQKVQVVDLGDSFPSRTIGLDPGVNVIAGIRPNRMSAVACDNIGGPGVDGTACDVETLLIAASAFNPGCSVTGAVPPAECFVQGGGVGEYSILPADADAQDGTCTGEQTGAQSTYGPGGVNSGCAQPIATYLGRANGNNVQVDDFVDPRMLMVIHEAFVQ